MSKNLQKLLNEILNYVQIPINDKKFISQINKYLSSKETFANKETLLKNIFHKRWLNYIDTPSDYMRSHNALNKFWIKLACELAYLFKTNKPIEILIPKLDNFRDSNSLNSFNINNGLTQFFLGYDDRSLYSIPDLITHLKKHNHVISLYRYNNLKRLSPITVDELARLKQSPYKLELANNNYLSIWEFMTNNVFSRYSADTKLALSLYSSFISLIETYFQLKSAQKPFSDFKEQFKQWCDSLLSCSIQSTNAFYGTRIPIKGNQILLIDLMINIYNKDKYDFHEVLTEVKRALEDVLKRNRFGLINCASKYQYQCYSLVVSILSFQFHQMFSKPVDFWDITRNVPSKIQDIYHRISALLYKTTTEDYAKGIQDISKNNIKSILCSKGYFKNNALTRWGVLADDILNNKETYNLYHPRYLTRFLMHSIDREYIGNNKKKLTNLIDDIFRTLSQRANLIEKEIRINIIFRGFLSQLNKNQKSSMLRELNNYNIQHPKKTFTEECSIYLDLRLNSLLIETKPNRKTIDFHSRFKLKEHQRLNFEVLIKRYKQVLYQFTKNELSDADIKKLTNYLRGLEKNIRTKEESLQHQLRCSDNDYMKSIMD